VPRVVIGDDPEYQDYRVNEVSKDFYPVDEDYQVVVDMKASHYRNIKRNEERFYRDQEFLQKFFIEAQESGRQIRER
jgi:hypothetical protein